MTIIPAFGRQWQADKEFEVILGFEANLTYMRPCLKINERGEKKELEV